MLYFAEICSWRCHGTKYVQRSAQLDTLAIDAQQPWKKKGGTASWMAAAGALESGDSPPIIARSPVSLLARHLNIIAFLSLVPKLGRSLGTRLAFLACSIAVG